MSDQPNTSAQAAERPDQNHRHEVISQATAFIVENETWMLTTCGSDHIIRSRPMLNVNQSFTGDLYLFAHSNDIAIRSLNENPQVNIVIAEPANRRYASITGKAKKVDDAKKSELLWNYFCRKYFEMESPSSEISLIKIDVDDVEFWDVSQSVLAKIGSFFRMTSSGLTEANVDHQKVDWSHSDQPISQSLLKHHSASGR